MNEIFEEQWQSRLNLHDVTCEKQIEANIDLQAPIVDGFLPSVPGILPGRFLFWLTETEVDNCEEQKIRQSIDYKQGSVTAAGTNQQAS